MEAPKRISAETAEDIWQQINADYLAGVDLHDYHVIINRGGTDISLNIVSSPGGSFEGGYDTTTLSCNVPVYNDFVFAIHPEDFLNKIGKLFGMQDVITGYPEFDKNVIVQTNNADQFKQVFAQNEVREVFQNLSGYSFKLTNHNESNVKSLELYVQRALINADDLLPVYNAFVHVLDYKL